MKKILLYTFRTFPWMEELSELNTELFVFGKLKDDLPKLFEIVEKTKPDIIIGVAKSPESISRFKTKAVNLFNTTKKVSKNGRPNYLLSFPSDGFKNIQLNNNYTDSFCNYVMYKIAENAKVKQQFIHLCENDKAVLRDYFKDLN